MTEPMVKIDEFGEVLRIEEVTEDQVRALGRMLTPIARMVCEFGSIDISKGRGVLHETNGDRCLWGKDKHRITVSLIPGGGLIASRSKNPDPDCPK